MSIISKQFVFVLLLALSTPIFADRIAFIDNKERSITGKITKITADNVTVEIRGESRDIAANKIASTVFDGEPTALRAARTAFKSIGYIDRQRKESAAAEIRA